MHIRARAAIVATVGAAILCFEPACDTYGLPPYTPPEAQQPTSSASDQADILDVNPKFGRVGEDTEVVITGINTTFTETTQVLFPDEPQITVTDIVVTNPWELTADLSIGLRAIPGRHVLQVRTDADGTLEFRDGFTVVE